VAPLFWKNQMSAEWFVLKNEKWQGPFTTAKIKLLVSSKQLQPTDQIRKGESGKAVLAEKVKGLFAKPNEAISESGVGTVVITRIAGGRKTNSPISVFIDGVEKGNLGSKGLFEVEKSLSIRVSSGVHNLDLTAAGMRHAHKLEVLDKQVIDCETYIAKEELFFRVVPHFTVADLPPKPESEPQWYYQSFEGEKIGPIPKTELSIRAWGSGKLNGKTLVYREGMDSWQMVGDVAPEVFDRPFDYRTAFILTLLPSSIRSKPWIKFVIGGIVVLALLARWRGQHLEHEKYRQRPRGNSAQQQSFSPARHIGVFLARGGQE